MRHLLSRSNMREILDTAASQVEAFRSGKIVALNPYSYTDDNNLYLAWSRGVTNAPFVPDTDAAEAVQRDLYKAWCIGWMTDQLRNMQLGYGPLSTSEIARNDYEAVEQRRAMLQR